ncbi:uncharacterized protein A4U43_C08F35060 [Asparagus officinalis]|uniref:WUSCHEL-related homeobox 4-like n=1 Tax=Asparagus officinalis TaxID=4686 RepID=UPI00098E63B3|nr:WUSCHEL-related homeobox 4-like [Asparagus officinalis]ONK61933.1 uncharacterized protein A4U43_C08F35060 [Asparagus officinalis]
MEPNSSSSSASASAASGSRWNPTKDQIAILESLYRQGLRTPSTEQIQQITARLREFGTTEGKNVFYWFQNHKARQRQRMKQESYYILKTSLIIVVCGPYCLPVTQGGAHVGLYPNMFMSRPVPVSPIEQNQLQRINEQRLANENNGNYTNGDDIETLQLFPLHPTGILEAHERSECPLIASASTVEPDQGVEEEDEGSENNNVPPLMFNFFG